MNIPDEALFQKPRCAH